MFLQYTNNSTTDKLTNSYSNLLTLVHIGYNSEIMMHTKARSFEFSKLKNLEKLCKPTEIAKICDPSKSQVRHHHSFKTWFEVEVSRLRSASPVVT